jgi:hypothetical protein
VTAKTLEEMKGRLRRLIAGGTTVLTVDIAVVEGSTGWSTTWTSATASAKVKLRVRFSNAQTGAPIVETYGDAVGTRSGFYVADDEPNVMFQAAALSAFDRAITMPLAIDALSKVD